MQYKHGTKFSDNRGKRLYRNTRVGRRLKENNQGLFQNNNYFIFILIGFFLQFHRKKEEREREIGREKETEDKYLPVKRREKKPATFLQNLSRFHSNYNYYYFTPPISFICRKDSNPHPLHCRMEVLCVG